MLKHSNPSYKIDTPNLSSMKIGKLGSGVALTLDTCNWARKTVYLIVDQVHEAAEALRKDNSNDIRVL